MKRALFSVVCVGIGVGGVCAWMRRGRAALDATAPPGAPRARAAAEFRAEAAAAEFRGEPDDPRAAGADPRDDPLASLAAVEWAAADAATPGTPSSIPAVPSIPAIGIRLQS